MIGVGFARAGAAARGRRTIARVALGVNGIALLLMVGPSLIDRFLHL